MSLAEQLTFHPKEKQTSKETEKEFPYDAIQLIEYQTDDGGEVRPNALGIMTIDAVVALLRRGESRNVVIAGVQVPEKNSSIRLSEVYANTLRKKLIGEFIIRNPKRIEDARAQIKANKHFTEEAIQIMPKDLLYKLLVDAMDIHIYAESELLPRDEIEQGSVDTSGDISFLLHQADKHHWENIKTVGIQEHLPRIRKILEAKGVIVKDESPNIIAFPNNLAVTLQSTQEVLKKYLPDYPIEKKYPPKKQKKFTRGENRNLKFMKIFEDPEGEKLSKIAKALPFGVKKKISSG